MQYPSLAPAPPHNIVADKDGYFSIEFTNVGMSGVREITNEFSRHGEIVKVQQSGGRNAVKKVTVSYQELEREQRSKSWKEQVPRLVKVDYCEQEGCQES